MKKSIESGVLFLYLHRWWSCIRRPVWLQTSCMALTIHEARVYESFMRYVRAEIVRQGVLWLLDLALGDSMF